MAKMNTNTRVPTAPLESIVDETKLVCRIGRETLSEQFPRLTADDRKAAAKPIAGFTKTARKAIEGADEFKSLFTAAEVSPGAIAEDINNLDVLYTLQREVDLLKTVVDDAVLLSGDEAYRALLKVYAVAKAVSGNRPETEEFIKQVGSLFTSVRASAAKNKKDKTVESLQ